MVKILNQGALQPGSGNAQIAAGTTSERGTAPSQSAESVSLDCLAPGQSAVISHIATDVAEAGLKMHLMELGFVSGSSITYLMSTPFGDPRIYSLRGTSIALRKSEARCIRVRT